MTNSQRNDDTRPEGADAAAPLPLILSDRDFAAVQRALDEPDRPNAALRAAAERFRRAIANGEIAIRDT